MRQFLYRFPRFQTESPMDFIHGDSIVLGVCRDVSESGLRGTFSLPVTVGIEGILTLYHDDQSFPVHARVFSLRNGEAGLRFRFASDQERDGIRAFLKLLAPAAK